MRATLYDTQNIIWELPLLYDWEICHGMGDTCDYFEFSLPFEKSMLPKLAGAVYFRGFNNDEVVFHGLIDEYTILWDENGSRVSMRGRSISAVLFDNEAEAASYARLSLNNLLERHIRPYGIGRFEKKDMPIVHRFTVASGESEWSVLSRFCRYSCGIQPRCSKDGVIILNDKKGAVRKIDGSSPVFSIKRRDCRYGIISSVLVKNRVTGASYTVHNMDFEARKGRCRRVLTVPKTTGADAIRYTAQYQIKESMRGKNTLEVGLCTQFAGFAGDIAELELPHLGLKGRYRIIKSLCWADGDDGGTYLTLEV